MNRPTPFAFLAMLMFIVFGGVRECSSGTRAQVNAAEARGAREAPDLARLAARTEPAVLLARMAWLEAGAHVAPGEVAAMHEVITTRQRGSYQRTAYAYSAGLRNPSRASTHRLTRRTLSAGWPRVHREHWPRVLAAADAAIAGELSHECDTVLSLVHWGGPSVDRDSITSLLRAGHQRATCPESYANTFLTRAP